MRSAWYRRLARLFTRRFARRSSPVARWGKSLPLGVELLEDRTVPAHIITGPTKIGSGVINIYDADTRALVDTINPFGAGVGVRLAMGDVTGDGVADIIAARGIGNQPEVKVFDGVTFDPLPGQLGNGFMAFNQGFRGGIFVAAGDVNGDGRDDIIVGQGKNGQGHVRVFNGVDGTLISSFEAFSGRGPVRVAAGDVDNDGNAEIIAAGGQGATARVKVFEHTGGDPLVSFRPFGANYRDGVFVAAGDRDGDGIAEIFVSRRLGKAEVKIFSASGVLLDDFVAFNGNRGARIGVSNNGNATNIVDTILTSKTRRGPAAPVKLWNSVTLSEIADLFAYGDQFQGGVFVTGQVEQGTRTTLTTSANPGSVGHDITFTATVVAPDANAPVTGTVEFFDGDTSLGSETVTNGQASIIINSLTEGTHNITAVYSGNFKGSTSAVLVQNVLPATTTTLTSSTDPSKFGETVTFSVKVTGPSTPTGTVELLNGDTVIGTATLDDNGEAEIQVDDLPVGTHSITARYLGSDTLGGSTSEAVEQDVEAADTTTELTSDDQDNETVFGESFTLTATVTATAPGGGVPTGDVELLDGDTVIATVALDANGQATFLVSNLAVGSHSLTARYVGSDNFNTSTSTPAIDHNVIEADTTTALESSAADNETVFGESFTLTATVTATAPGAGVPTGDVEFLDGVTVLGLGTLDENGVAAFVVTDLSVGVHSLTARYVGSADFTTSTSSPAIDHEVIAAETTTTLESSADEDTTVFGAEVTFTATVAAQSPGSGVPTGDVEFLDGDTVIGTGTLNDSGVAAFIISTLSVASHSITARYVGSTDFNSSTSSPPIELTVAQASTTTVLDSEDDDDTSVFGEEVVFTATVSAVAPSQAIPTGSVELIDGTDVIATVLLMNGVATFNISDLGVGVHSLTARYAGGINFNVSLSTPAIEHTVTAAGTTTTLTSSDLDDATVFGEEVTFTAEVTADMPSGATPTGTVNFLDGANIIGSAALVNGIATFNISTLEVGTHPITAVYVGTAEFTGSSSVAIDHDVDQASTLTELESSVNPSVFGQPVTFTATVTVEAPGGGTPTGSVTFFNGAVELDTVELDANGQASITISDLIVGDHDITAEYLGSTEFAGSTSAIVTQTVSAAATLLLLETSDEEIAEGEEVTFTATVSVQAPGGGTPTGTVEFFEGGNLLGSSPLVDGVAEFSTTTLPVGELEITAVFTSDAAEFQDSDGGPITQTVTA